jgi:hypothetical protein
MILYVIKILPHNHITNKLRIKSCLKNKGNNKITDYYVH